MRKREGEVGREAERQRETSSRSLRVIRVLALDVIGRDQSMHPFNLASVKGSWR